MLDILSRAVRHDGEDLTVDALVTAYVAHMGSPVREILRGAKRVPPRASLARAAALTETGRPLEVGQTAAWLDLLEALAEAGLSAEERLGVVLAVLRLERPLAQAPGRAVVAHAAAEVRPLALREVVAALEQAPIRGVRLTTVLVATSLARLGERVPLEGVDPLLLPPSVARAHLAPRDPSAREAALLPFLEAVNGPAARAKLDAAWHLLDLFDTPTLRERLQALRAQASDAPGAQVTLRRLDGGVPVPGWDRLNEAAREALAYWDEALVEERRRAGLGAMAEHAVHHRVPVAGAPEIASLDAWTAASPQRRRAAAEAVLRAVGPGFVLVESEPFALLKHAKSRAELVLVPGGSFVQGLSGREEATLRAQAEARGIVEVHEEWGALLDRLPDLRPTREVAVGPMLLGRKAGKPLSPAKLASWLEKGPFRLPTESEWERAARGGADGSLTFRGDEPPDAAWYRVTTKLGAKAANAFGAWGFGLEPEVCADLFAPGYAGAPVDGAPVTGAGPRVVRGGAAALHPWQGAGEWHLLLCAMRTSQARWEDLAARPVLGLVATG